MRELLAVLAFGIALALPFPASDGDCGSGYGCQNMCPLARTASTHRAAGQEAVKTSVAMREVMAKTLARNLARI